MEEVRKVGGVRRSLACGARLPNTLLEEALFSLLQRTGSAFAMPMLRVPRTSF
jgi:hypothetical protein